MTTPYENFVNIALGKALSSDVTLPTADKIPVFTGIGRQVTGKTKAELGLALTADLDTDGTLADNSDTKYPSQKAVKTYADTKQAALADVITANTYGSSTQYPVITFNAKGIATAVTLQTPTFTDATFSVQKNDSPAIAATWSLSALTESRVHTYPNKDIDFKTLSSVGASDSNSLSGTRNRIVGGNGNHVSGTDVVVINSTELLATSAPQGLTVIGGFRINSLESGLRVPAGSIILGSSRSPDLVLADSFSGGALGTISCLYTNRISSNGTFAVTADGGTESTSNSVRFGNAFSGTVFDVDFIVSIGYAHEVGNTVPNRTLFARRRVFVLVYASNPTDLLSSTTLYASTVTTPESDQSIGGTAAATVSVSVTVDTTNKMIVPKVTFTASGVENAFQASVRVTAHCSRKA